MASLPGIIDGMEARLQTISGLRVSDYPPGSVSPPAAYVGIPEEIRYDRVFGRGADTWRIPVVVLVSRSTERLWRAAMAEYLSGNGTKSVKAAFEADVTLGGAAQTSRLESGSPAIFTVGGVDYFGCSFTVEVIA